MSTVDTDLQLERWGRWVRTSSGTPKCNGIMGRIADMAGGVVGEEGHRAVRRLEVERDGGDGDGQVVARAAVGVARHGRLLVEPAEQAAGGAAVALSAGDVVHVRPA